MAANQFRRCVTVSVHGTACWPPDSRAGKQRAIELLGGINDDAGAFIVDTLSVTDYLRNRFGKEKIYLMAHSGGACSAPGYLYSAAELINHAADLSAASSALTHENERRWRIFHQRLEQIASG